MLVTLDDLRTMTYYWPPPHKIQFWIVYAGAVPPYGGAAFSSRPVRQVYCGGNIRRLIDCHAFFLPPSHIVVVSKASAQLRHTEQHFLERKRPRLLRADFNTIDRIVVRHVGICHRPARCHRRSVRSAV